MSENITVAVRIRPLQKDEQSLVRTRRQTMLQLAGEPNNDRTVSVVDNLIVFDPQKKSKELKKTFAFDTILDESCTQTEVFEKTTKSLIQHVLNGFNSTVFAYGATGCGKTFTITGTTENPGIIFQTMNELYTEIERLSNDFIIETGLSFLEVYNETIKDLFSNSNNVLDIREDDSKIIVAGLNEIIPRNLDHIMKLLLQGNENRTKAFTHANAVSSRSHAILQINVRKKARIPMGDDSIKVATLSIIDLAGSERASATMNKGERLHEGANINRSLLALGNCINALCSDKPTHIPFRNSKLTRLLKYSLNGNCRGKVTSNSVVMIANISPAIKHHEETLNTLKYANRAKDIKTKITQNIVNVSAQVAQYPKIIQNLQEEIAKLRSEISNACTAPITAEMKYKLEKIKSLHHKILEKQIIAASNEQELAINEDIIVQIRSILLAVTNEIKLEDRKQLNDSILLLNQAMDNLHAINVTLTHNAEEAKRSVLKHQQKIKELQLCNSNGDQIIETLFCKLQLEREAAFYHRQDLLFNEKQSNLSNRTNSLLRLNLSIFQSCVGTVSGNLDDASKNHTLARVMNDFVSSFVREFTPSIEQIPQVSYETCTEDDTSDHTFTEKVSKLKVDTFATPTKSQNRIEEEEDLSDTPVAKKPKKTPMRTAKKVHTPRKSVRKTPRRKMRMSMIPIMKSSILHNW